MTSDKIPQSPDTADATKILVELLNSCIADALKTATACSAQQFKTRWHRQGTESHEPHG